VGHIDEEGYLFITDRKKDIIITAGGKNVAPQNIENLMKTSPYISQAMVHGDKKPYLTMLVTLDEDETSSLPGTRKSCTRI
jgi:long-chain acyl-CoA synthetase